MVVVIGSDDQNVVLYLSQHGIQAVPSAAAQIPSLTAMLLTQKEISDIVFLPGEEKNWSMGHILSAAKQLQGKGRIFFCGPDTKPPALICTVTSVTELLDQLKRPLKKSSDSGGAKKQQPPEKPLSIQATTQTSPAPPVRPMTISPGCILILGVIGSQHRIGCTTQAVGLWHYCKALGFYPAIVSGKEQIAQIAAPMRCERIAGGYRIEGIPFIVDAAQAYDCYILDIGTGSIPEARKASDVLILVAGTKPWEIQNTAAAIKAARGLNVPLILSYSSQADADSLSRVFGHHEYAVAPWMPDLWTAGSGVLQIYDNLLRPILERFLTVERNPENEIELKGS